MSEHTRQVTAANQTRLSGLGYYRLRIDGKDGPGTLDAFTRFKAAHGLLARPFVGPLTLSKLWGPEATPWATPPALTGEGNIPWLTEARAHLGLREVKGPGNNPTIMGWADDLDQWYPGDDVAWCGLYVAHCMATGAPDEPQDFNRLAARAWLGYGRDALDGADPATASLPLGGIAVFWRTARNHWHGHVALITGQNASHVRCIGGNQGDSVSEAWFPRDRLLGVRRPSGAVLHAAPKAATGTLSLTEA